MKMQKTSFKMLDEIANKPLKRPLLGICKRLSLKGNIEFRNVSFKYPESEVYALKRC